MVKHKHGFSWMATMVNHGLFDDGLTMHMVDHEDFNHLKMIQG